MTTNGFLFNPTIVDRTRAFLVGLQLNVPKEMSLGQFIEQAPFKGPVHGHDAFDAEVRIYYEGAGVHFDYTFDEFNKFLLQ